MAIQATPRHLVPANKDDLSAVEELRLHIQQFGFDLQVVSVLPQLLSWIVDLHWPVASELAHTLRGAGEILVEPLREILQSSDAGAQFAIITVLVRRLNNETISALLPALCRVALTLDEEGASEAASELIGSLVARSTDF